MQTFLKLSTRDIVNKVKKQKANQGRIQKTHVSGQRLIFLPYEEPPQISKKKISLSEKRTKGT